MASERKKTLKKFLVIGRGKESFEMLKGGS